MRTSRKWGGVAAALAVVASAALTVAPAAQAADPATGTLSPASPTVRWAGAFTLPGALSTGDCSPPNECDRFELVVDLEGGTGEVRIDVTQTGDLDFPGIILSNADGRELGSASGAGTATLRVDDLPEGTYAVDVVNGATLPAGTYEATATLTPGPPAVDPDAAPGDGEPVAFTRDDDQPVATAEVPLRVVLVGFDEGSVEEADVFAQIPDFQRVSSLYTYDGALRSGDNGLPVSTLLNHGRSYYDADEPFLLPIEYRWDPELVYAPSAFASGLFEHMVANSSTGDYADPVRRTFLDAYNATRGSLYRTLASGDPAQAVAPLADVRFVDGESTEDWIAANSEELLGFEAGREPGEAGYTVFVLNSWDAPEAEAAFPAGEYHVFKIDRTDPDRGDFDGIDWARVWGGRYRFMLLDLGAAPNPYEAESWGNRGRSALGSTLHDPPLWEFRAGAPRPVDATELVQGLEGPETAIDPTDTLDEDDLVTLIARTVNEAVNFRFFHSYLYEPRPGTGRFFLSDNVWHDDPTLYRSDLQELYDQEAALNGLRTLTPYFEFDGDVVYQYLEDLDVEPEYVEDKAALDAAKQGGDDVAGVPHLSMRTEVMMDYIDSKPERFLRGGACATTVPTIQVVVPGHYAWALPIAAGIATNRGGVPWGFLNSVNDVTKWNGADKDQTLVLAHPNVLYNGTFTYTTIHEASHYLGLAHPHDTVGAARNPDGSPRYYDGFTWTFNTTAAPTTYSHVETVYSILDQESIARGHLSFYLQWAYEALEETGAQLIAGGTTTVGQLDPEAATQRQTALERAERAQALFADFQFVEATFAAQDAWEAAATYRDLALDLEPGTTQVERGTQLGTDAELEDAGCSATASTPGPVPEFHPGAAPTAGQVGAGHVHGASEGAGSVRLPATGGDPAPLGPLLLGAGLTVAAVARLARRPG